MPTETKLQAARGLSGRVAAAIVCPAISPPPDIFTVPPRAPNAGLLRFLRLLAVWLVLVALGPWSGAQAAEELRQVRLWSGPDSTRVVFELQGPVRHRVFTLTNPDRLVLDIENARRADGLDVPSQAKGVIKGFRSGPRGDDLRVVFDLTHPVSPRTFNVAASGDYGFRLIVDLYDAEPASTGGNTPADNVPAPVPVPVLPSASTAAVVPPAATAGAANARTAAHARPRIPAAPLAPIPPPVTPGSDSILVVIDPGHGGEDPGTRSRNGVMEKDVVLSIARRLARLVNAQPGMRAMLTRDSDYYVGLRERLMIARRAHADVFVSIHANSVPQTNLRGAQVYAMSLRGSTSEHARLLASRENASDLAGGVESQAGDDDLAAVLIDISQGATMEASLDLGSRLLGALSHVTLVQRRDVQQAAFAVLKAPDVPSVLVETAFLTNDEDVRNLRDGAYQHRFALALLEGIKGYFASYRAAGGRGVLTAQVRDVPTDAYASPLSGEGTAGVTIPVLAAGDTFYGMPTPTTGPATGMIPASLPAGGPPRGEAMPAGGLPGSRRAESGASNPGTP